MGNTSQSQAIFQPLKSPSKFVIKPYFRADIEGLRAIAILFVVAYHAKIPGFAGGYIGVDIFFVISGYLITWLLLHEVGTTGRIDLLKFYTRRARRLLPALALMFFVTIGISALLYAPFEQLELAKTAFSAATYLSNLYFAQAAVNYLGEDINASPFLHTWSLSVEEQFYLVWPLLVMLITGAAFKWQKLCKRNTVLFCLIAIVVSSFLWSFYLTTARQPAAFFQSPSRAWEFGAGALGLLIPSSQWRLPKRYQYQMPKWTWLSQMRLSVAELLGWLGLGGIAISAVVFDDTTHFPGLAVLLPALSTILVLHSCATEPVEGKSRLFQLLNGRLLQKLGCISYSWYLWHWPVLVFAGILSQSPLPLLARIGLVLFSLLLAEISYRFLENPIRYSSFLQRKAVYSVIMAVVITLINVKSAVAWQQSANRWAQQPAQAQYSIARESIPPTYENGCHTSFFSTTPQIEGCWVNAGDRRFSVVLMGDSHAAQWYGAIARLAVEHQWQFLSMTKSGCSYADVRHFAEELGRNYDECDLWRKNAIAQIKSIQPNLTIIASVTGSNAEKPVWQAGIDSTLRSLSAASRHVIIIRDTPRPGFDVPVCLARRAWQPTWLSKDSCLVSNATALGEPAYQTEKEVVQHYPNASVVDMTLEICEEPSCNLERRGTVVFRDDGHMTDAFSTALSPDLYDKIKAVVK